MSCPVNGRLPEEQTSNLPKGILKTTSYKPLPDDQRQIQILSKELFEKIDQGFSRIENFQVSICGKNELTKDEKKEFMNLTVNTIPIIDIYKIYLDLQTNLKVINFNTEKSDLLFKRFKTSITSFVDLNIKIYNEINKLLTAHAPENKKNPIYLTKVEILKSKVKAITAKLENNKKCVKFDPSVVDNEPLNNKKAPSLNVWNPEKGPPTRQQITTQFCWTLSDRIKNSNTYEFLKGKTGMIFQIKHAFDNALLKSLEIVNAAEKSKDLNSMPLTKKLTKIQEILFEEYSSEVKEILKSYNFPDEPNTIAGNVFSDNFTIQRFSYQLRILKLFFHTFMKERGTLMLHEKLNTIEELTKDIENQMHCIEETGKKFENSSINNQEDLDVLLDLFEMTSQSFKCYHDKLRIKKLHEEGTKVFERNILYTSLVLETLKKTVNELLHRDPKIEQILTMEWVTSYLGYPSSNNELYNKNREELFELKRKLANHRREITKVQNQQPDVERICQRFRVKRL